MKKCDHPNIVKYLGHESIEPNFMLIYMEYLKNGTLGSYIKK